MQGKDLLIGTLKKDSYLRTESGEILLTRIPMQAAQSPESEALEIALEDVGKTALVRGDLSGKVLYSASVVEALSPIASILFKTLIDKGVVSLEEIHHQISELESLEKETKNQRKLCALVIGHKKHSPGAINADANLSEFDFNEGLALRIEKKVQKTEMQRIYRRTYKELPDDVNVVNPDFIVSLHCNAFNGQASGTEALHYHRSEKGKKMAEIALDHLVGYLKLPNRGIKQRTAEDRGGYLLRYSKAPCVIAEPFFIDNDSDLARAEEDIDGLAAVYANAIDEISQIV